MIMVRYARERSESGIYHVVMRGINQQDIFCDGEDYQQFLATIKRVKADRFELYGYCLMSNHIHLLIHEKSEEIHQVMKRVGTSYALCYNQKYFRTGHLFQGRYKSECVENEKYLLTVIRYIHNNPVKARVANKPEDYRWSSIHAYYGENEYLNGLTNAGYILGIFSEVRPKAIRRFHEHMGKEANDTCLDDERKLRKTDEEMRTEIEANMNGIPVTALQNMERPGRNEILRRIKAIEGATIRQIARITGLNYNIIFRA